MCQDAVSEHLYSASDDSGLDDAEEQQARSAVQQAAAAHAESMAAAQQQREREERMRRREQLRCFLRADRASTTLCKSCMPDLARTVTDRTRPRWCTS